MKKIFNTISIILTLTTINSCLFNSNDCSGPAPGGVFRYLIEYTGHIKDFNDSLPVPGVNVLIAGKYSRKTDSNGSYFVSDSRCSDQFIPVFSLNMNKSGYFPIDTIFAGFGGEQIGNDLSSDGRRYNFPVIFMKKN